MPDLQKVKESILKVEAALEEVKKALEEKDTFVSANIDQESFNSLKMTLNSDQWPTAANKNLICDPDNNNDKVERGRGIIELMIDSDLTGKKFLDYGCGEGYTTAYVATKKTTLSVGYDISSKGWGSISQADNLKLTQKWDEVVNNGPYNFILVFDVLDHIQGTTPTEALQKMREVLADDGVMYVRTHPFTSRHALHNYHHLNKGYIHLVFTPEEVKTLLDGAKHIEPNIGVKYPLATYKKWFDEARLTEIGNCRPIKDLVEPIFKTPALAQRIQNNLGFEQFPEFQMSMQFVDYRLKKAT